MSTRDHEFISQVGATFFLTSSVMGWKHVFIKPIFLDVLIKCLVFYQAKLDDMLRQKLDYIHYNPLQSHWELVTEAFSYPFSSCKYYDSGEDSQGLEILNLL